MMNKGLTDKADPLTYEGSKFIRGLKFVALATIFHGFFLFFSHFQSNNLEDSIQLN